MTERNQRPPWRVLMTLVPLAPLGPPPRPSFQLPPPHFSTPRPSAVPLSSSLVRCMAVPACLAAILVDTDGGYTYSDQAWWPYQLVQWTLFLVCLGILVLCVMGRLAQASRIVRMWLLYHGALLTVTSVVFIPQMDHQEGDQNKKWQWRVPGLPFSIAHLLAGRENSRQAALLLLLASICLMSLLYYCIHAAHNDHRQVPEARRPSAACKAEDACLPSYEAAMRASRGQDGATRAGRGAESSMRAGRGSRREPAAWLGEAAWRCEPPNYEEALRAGAVSPFGRRSRLFQRVTGGDEGNEHVVVVEDMGGAETDDIMVIHIVEDSDGAEEHVVVLEDMVELEEVEIVVEGEQGDIEETDCVKVVVLRNDIALQDSDEHNIMENSNDNNVQDINEPENDKGNILTVQQKEIEREEVLTDCGKCTLKKLNVDNHEDGDDHISNVDNHENGDDDISNVDVDGDDHISNVDGIETALASMTTGDDNGHGKNQNLILKGLETTSLDCLKTKKGIVEDIAYVSENLLNPEKKSDVDISDLSLDATHNHDKQSDKNILELAFVDVDDNARENVIDTLEAAFVAETNDTDKQSVLDIPEIRPVDINEHDTDEQFDNKI